MTGNTPISDEAVEAGWQIVLSAALETKIGPGTVRAIIEAAAPLLVSAEAERLREKVGLQRELLESGDRLASRLATEVEGLRAELAGIKAMADRGSRGSIGQVHEALNAIVAALGAAGGQEKPLGPMFEGAHAGPLNLDHADTSQSPAAAPVGGQAEPSDAQWGLRLRGEADPSVTFVDWLPGSRERAIRHAEKHPDHELVWRTVGPWTAAAAVSGEQATPPSEMVGTNTPNLPGVR